MRGACLALLLLLAGCHRDVAGPAAPAPGSLAGVTLPLLPSPNLRLVVEGRLGGQPVPVVLDISRPLSLVSAGCRGEGAPPPEGTARVPEASGGMREWPLVRLSSWSVGGVALGRRRVGLSGERTCVVTLGADVLAPYALTLNPLRREVSFTPSRPRAAHAAELSGPGADPSEEVHLLELSRDPIGDWPLLVAQVTQGEARLTGPFVLETREPFSRLAVGPAQAQGLRPLETVAGLPPRAFAVDGVEVAAGVSVQPLVMEAGPGWRHPGTLGRLGLDVWGHFHVTVDVQGDALVLRRPRVLAAEQRQRCARPGSDAFREESCFALDVRRAPRGRLAVTGTVYRDLPEGGRLHLEPLGEAGRPLEAECKVGLSFAPGSRGASTQHLVPWPRLAQALPECHEALLAARGYSLALFEEGALQECPATCVFVHQPSTRRTLCECQPSPLGEAVAAPRRKQGPRLPSPRERELEPEDPR